MARINVENIYQTSEGQSFFELYNYEPMVTAFGQRTIVAVDDYYHQGDSYRLIADGDEPGQRYGVLIFGWGSCSGCDALQSCSSFKEVQELADSTQDSIKWFADKEALRKYVVEHDWKGDYSWPDTELHKYLHLVKEFLDSDRD
ncbi:MAG TPA: hypothetical protein V6C81_12150 [Planktothrix sp.]